MTRRISVVPYDPDWPKRFEEEADELSRILAEEIVAIHHIGSTAIPGIAAKPIIDVLVEVRDIDRIDDYDDVMIERGYVPKGEYGIPGRRFFIKGDEEHRTHHVHVFQTGSSEIERHLAFRDYVIAHPKQARAYSRLKQDLARRFPEDIESYMDGKHDFVREMERKALAWRTEVRER